MRLFEISGGLMGRYTDAARKEVNDFYDQEPPANPTADKQKKLDRRSDSIGRTVAKKFKKDSTGYASPKLSADDFKDLVITTYGHDHYHTVDDAMEEYLFRDDKERDRHGPERIKLINDALREIGTTFRVNKISGPGSVNGWNKDFYHIVDMSGNIAGTVSPEERSRERDQTRKDSYNSTSNMLDQKQADKSRKGPPAVRPPSER